MKCLDRAWSFSFSVKGKWILQAEEAWNATACLLQHRRQQCMLRRLEWIEHRHASPGKSVLEILAEEQAALLIGGHGKDQRVPIGIW